MPKLFAGSFLMYLHPSNVVVHVFLRAETIPRKCFHVFEWASDNSETNSPIVSSSISTYPEGAE